MYISTLSAFVCWSLEIAVNILIISVFDALSIGSGLVAAVLLCIKRGLYLRQLPQHLYLENRKVETNNGDPNNLQRWQWLFPKGI